MTASSYTGFFSSKAVWGSLIDILTGLYTNLPEIIATVLPVLQPHTAIIVQAVGGLLAVFGRLNPNIKPIKGAL
jgi:hypothetical protein